MISTLVPSRHEERALECGRRLGIEPAVHAAIATQREQHDSLRGFYVALIENMRMAVQAVGEREGWSTEVILTTMQDTERAMLAGLLDIGVEL